MRNSLGTHRVATGGRRQATSARHQAIGCIGVGRAGGSIGGIGVGRAGGPAAGEHQQNENINGVAGKPPMVMTKRQSFDFRPLLVM